MRLLNNMTISADKTALLAKLRDNREEHAAIVVEAREGYVKKASAAVEKRLGQLKEGKIVSLHFSLKAPQDHTKIYDTAIRMLELHQDSTITLSAQQVRNLEMDDWDWMDEFLGVSAGYSARANDKLNSR